MLSVFEESFQLSAVKKKTDVSKAEETSSLVIGAGGDAHIGGYVQTGAHNF